MLSVNDYLYDGESVCIGRKGTIDKPMLLTGKFWTVDTLFYTHSFKNNIKPLKVFPIYPNSFFSHSPLNALNLSFGSRSPSAGKSCCIKPFLCCLSADTFLIPNNMPLCTHGAFMTIFRSKLAIFLYQLFQTSDYWKQVEAEPFLTQISISLGSDKFAPFIFILTCTLSSRVIIEF
jgi:hypothetical protein